ncbi:trypsin-like serine peptidase [Spirillospora sp. NPDC050679]
MRRLLIGGMAGALGVSAAVAAGAPAAVAAPAKPGTTVTAAAPVSADVQKAINTKRMSRDGAVQAYWTPERMRTAIPLDAKPKRVAGAPAPQAGPVRAVAPAKGSAKAVAPKTAGKARTTAAAAAVNASATVGKVFFRNATDGLNYVCSAGTVNSSSKRIISTAGHCVHGGAGGNWHQNWTFVPYYNYGNRPYGTWSANQLVSFTGWTNSSNFDYDVAFVKANDLNGVRIVNSVGGNGIQTGQSKSRAMTILGYPSEAPYPGDWQYFCQGTTAASGNRISMPCPLTRGVSGGPWLFGYDSNTGLGYVNGTSSTTNAGRTTLWSPYFSADVWNLYNYTNNLG